MQGSKSAEISRKIADETVLRKNIGKWASRLLWIENQKYSLASDRRRELSNGPIKTHGLPAMQPASSAGKPHSHHWFPLCSWLAEKKGNKQHYSILLVQDRVCGRSNRLFFPIRLNAMRELVAKLNDVVSLIVVSKQLIQRKNVGPMPKWLSMVFGFQEVSPCRRNNSFCTSLLYLHNIYLSSPLPAFNNIARSLTTTCKMATGTDKES